MRALTLVGHGHVGWVYAIMQCVVPMRTVAGSDWGLLLYAALVVARIRSMKCRSVMMRASVGLLLPGVDQCMDA